MLDLLSKNKRDFETEKKSGFVCFVALPVLEQNDGLDWNCVKLCEISKALAKGSCKSSTVLWVGLSLYVRKLFSNRLEIRLWFDYIRYFLKQNGREHQLVTHNFDFLWLFHVFVRVSEWVSKWYEDYYELYIKYLNVILMSDSSKYSNILKQIF